MEVSIILGALGIPIGRYRTGGLEKAAKSVHSEYTTSTFQVRDALLGHTSPIWSFRPTPP